MSLGNFGGSALEPRRGSAEHDFGISIEFDLSLPFLGEEEGFVIARVGLGFFRGILAWIFGAISVRFAHCNPHA